MIFLATTYIEEANVNFSNIFLLSLPCDLKYPNYMLNFPPYFSKIISFECQSQCR